MTKKGRRRKAASSSEMNKWNWIPHSLSLAIWLFWKLFSSRLNSLSLLFCFNKIDFITLLIEWHSKIFYGFFFNLRICAWSIAMYCILNFSIYIIRSEKNWMAFCKNLNLNKNYSTLHTWVIILVEIKVNAIFDWK